MSKFRPQSKIGLFFLVGLFFWLGSFSVASKTQFQTYLMDAEAREDYSIKTYWVCSSLAKHWRVALTGFHEWRPRLAEGGISRRTKKNNDRSKNSARIFWTVCLPSFGGLKQRRLRQRLLYQSKRQLSIRQSNVLIPLSWCVCNSKSRNTDTCSFLDHVWHEKF